MRLPRIRVLAGASLVAVLATSTLTACPADGGRRAPGTASTGVASTGSASTGSATRSPAGPSASAASGGHDAAVSDALEDMDERERVAQLFLVGVPLDDLGAGGSVVRTGAGGVFLSGRSAAAAEELAATTAGWQSMTDGPALWIAVDQEGGSVQTLKGPGFARLPPARAQGALPPDDVAALAGDLGRSLDRAGVNLNLAPVVDVVPAGTEEGNAPIGSYDRQYGSTAAEVARAARTVVDGLGDAGVTATLKHFPGLGRVRGNPDDTAEVVDPVTRAGDEQVAVFGTLARSPAAPFVMVSSATYPRIDPGDQAMFSSVVMTDVLRGDLGFEGVILSDDVGAAEAVQDLPPGERAVRFLQAGGTMVLTVQRADVPAMIDEVVAASRRDAAFAATVDAAVRTALLAKARAGLLPAG